MLKLNKKVWNDRYLNKEIGWDIGQVSTPLKEYFDQLDDKNIKILIPGCGNAYEAEYLFHSGFKNIYLIDWAQKALNDFHKRNPEFPVNNLICDDFFNHQGTYDLIVEQTFFCAINPSLRKNYVAKMKQLIAVNGKLVGLLFNDKLYSERPPFGGKKSDYIKLFSNYFDNVFMEKAYNSIPPRKERELFIIIS